MRFLEFPQKINPGFDISCDTSLSPSFFFLLGEGLFDRIARTCCRLDGVVPRKELHENWEVANRISSHFPGTTRVADLAGGNGLLGWMLLLIHDEQNLAAQLHNRQSAPASASPEPGDKKPQSASSGRGGSFGGAAAGSGTFNRPRLSVLCVDKVIPDQLSLVNEP